MLLVSESANDKDLFYNNIVPVQLSPLELAEFKSVFFPKAPKKAGEDASDDGEDGEDGDGDSIKKEGGAAYEDLYNVLYELNNIGTRVNAAYAIARMCLQENANSSTKHPTYDWQQPFPEHLKNRAKSIIADYVAKSDEHFKDYSLPLFQEIKESYITNSSRGKAKLNKKHCVPYIIKPSVTHKNGYDVMWVGKTGNSFGNSPLLGAVSEFKGNRYYHPNFPESVVSIEYDSWTSKHRADESRYSIDDDAVQMMDIIEQLNIILTDGEASNIGSMHKRIFKVLPLDFDFKRINKLLLQNLQIKPFENLIAKNLNASVPRLAALKSHFSILVIVNPNPSVVTEVVRSITNKKSFDPADKLATQVLKTSPDISFSLVMHLSEKESHYITQTPANEVVSLVSLHQWVRQWSKYGFKGSRIMPPDHIVSAGLLSTFSEKRAKYGHYVEKGNNDKNNITVAYNGTLIYCPKLEHLGFVKNNAAEFEKSSNEILKQFYDKNICPNFDTLHVDQTVDAEQNAIVSDSLVENIRSMRKIKGTMLSCTWDYNRIIYASDDPSIISAIKLGGVTPDALALADYMNNPFEKGLSLTSKTVAVKQKGKTSDTNDEEMLDEEMYYGLSHALTTSVCKLYTNLYSKGLVKSFQELLNEAKEHFGIKSLIDDKLEGYEDGLYKDVMSSDLIEKAGVDYEEGRKILLTLQTALNNAAGYTNTKLYQVIARLVSSNEVDVTLKSSNRFFRSEERYEVKCKLSDYKNVYNWFGGYVYYLALCQIRDTGSKVFEINDIENYPTAAQLSTKIMPYVVMMSVYVKDSDDIYRKAEQLRERNRPLDKTREEINNQILVLGSTSTAQQLPHQVDEQKILRNRPKIVLLDCQAGGGKTITCLIDIACTMRECKAEKIAIKPLIIVPTQLVKNWCEDFIKIVGSNWNYIPINTEVVKRWGFERLHKMISDAPPNTVVIVAMDFLSKSNKYSVIVGDEVEKNSMSVEFIKNFGFNYIAIDEAHKLKTSDTATHILCKQICSMSNIKYLRLLSGTMIPNELKDIVGIASLCSGHIFRTGAEFEKLRAELAENGKFGDKDIVKRRAVGQLIRDRLKETVALITVKRKEWAFLLPSPIERFISVYLSFAEEERFMGDAASKPSSGEGSLEDVMSSTHRAVYEAVLGAAIAKLIQDIKGRKKGDDGDVIDGDDDDDDSSGSGKVKIKGKPPKLNPSTGKYEYDDDFEIDDDTLESMLSTSAGKYFYQRIDRVIMDPESDPLGAEMFDKLRETYPDMKFVSRKVKKIIEILNEHFTTPANWQRGKYKAYSLVTFDNKTFSAVNPHNDTKTFESILPPDRDTQNWKEETSGKVIIVTRYDRSVEGIYNNLPEDIKKMTITLYGQNSIFENKFNFKSFESDPNIKIMIANEQRITVGFNLQFASRIIRAEAPWTPGDLEQTNSRIFRPDPSGFLKGKMMRNVIWLDWIICDNTLEVIKMAKLYRKAIQNCQYEEGDNTDANGKNLYETIMEFDPPPLKLNKAKLQGDITLADIESTYIDPYSEYVGIRNEDFDTMRQKEDGCMIPMVYTEKVPDDFKVINNVPFVYSQKIPDPHNFEFESLNSFMGERTNANYLNTLLKYGLDSGIAKKQSTQRKIVPTMVSVEKFPLFKSLPSRTKDGQLIRDSKGKVVRKTLFVRYEGGYGTISGLGLSFRKEGVSPLEKLEITTIDHQKVIVDLKKTEVFICNNVDDLNFAIIKNSKSVDFGSTKIKSKITTLDDTIDSIIDVDDIEEVATPVRKPPSVSLIPAVYNRFVALEVVPEAGANIDAIQTILDQCASGMSGVGFFYHSNYAHIKVHNKASFKAIFAFLRDNGFQMSANSIPILKSLQAAFNKDTQQFAADLAPIGEMKTFFAASHKVANDKKSLKVYPLISSGSLQLLVDLNTNKHFRMLLNKPIEGINTNDKSFKKSDGMFLALVNNKAQLAAMIGSVKKSKLNIVNADDLKNLYLNLKTHTGEDVK